METVPCPECARPNASHKVRCLYCGETMPNPTAPPVVRPSRAVPEDPDKLVRSALRTGRLRDLSVALHAPPPGEDLSEPEDTMLGSKEPVIPVAAVPAGEALLALLHEVEVLRHRSDAERAQGLLEHAPRLLADLNAVVGEEVAEQARVTVELPPIRFAWMLLVGPWGHRTDLPALAAAAALDQATLRMQGRHGYAQVIARSEDREDLAGRAARVAALGLSAQVIGREDLGRIDAPKVVLRRSPEGRWLGTGAALWQAQESFDPAAPPAGEPLGDFQVSLVVPGDVVVQRFRQSGDGGRLGRKRDGVARPVGERRVGVLDLHGAGTFLRVLEGVTDLASLPGGTPGASRRSLVAFQEQLDQVFPGAEVAARRLCQSADRAPTLRGGIALARTGWPRFEEHTRLLRLATLGAEG